MRDRRAREPGDRVTTISPTDADLVLAARAHPAAFDVIYQRYRADLLRYCYYCLGDWDEAADASQQVFMNAFAALPRFTDRDNSFRPWLFRIAHNEIRSRQRQQSRWPQSRLDDADELMDHTPSPEALAIAADEHQRLWLLLAHLPPDRRRVCELRLAGLTDGEIGTILGKNVGAVRTAQSRAVAQLRNLLGVERTANRGPDG